MKDVRAYIEKIEKFLDDEEVKAVERAKKYAQDSVDESDESAAANDLLSGMMIYMRHGRHLNIFAKTSVMMVYSCFENVMSQVTEFMASARASVKRPDGVKGGSVIENRKEYLERYHGFNFEKMAEEWARIEDFRELRNILVHNNGGVGGRYKVIFDTRLKGISGLSVSFGSVVVEVSYVLEVLVDIECYLNELHRQLDALVAGR